MKPLLYDLIKQDFMNLEKGKILMYDLIKFNSENGNEIITVDTYLKNTSKYNLNRLNSIDLKSFPDDISSIVIEVGSKYSSTYCNITITKSENKFLFKDVLSDEETVCDTIKDINTLLNTKVLSNNKTIIKAVQSYDNELSITVSGQDEQKPIDFIELTLEGNVKEKPYVSPYVWVTPNTINPKEHDMKIYDVRLNGITYTPEYGEILEYDFQDLKSKSSYSMPRLILLTGQVVNGGDPGYSIYQEDYTITIGNGQATLSECNDESYSGKTLFAPGVETSIMNECIGQTMQTAIQTNSWDLPWLGIKTKKLPTVEQIGTNQLDVL